MLKQLYLWHVNTNLKDNISFIDVCKKTLDKKIKAIYDKSTLDSEGQVMSFNEQAAIITHYIQLKDKGIVSDEFADKAEDLMQLWYDFVNGNPPRPEGLAAEGRYYGSFFDNMTRCPFPAPTNPKFKFIDLFAGIGGFRSIS